MGYILSVTADGFWGVYAVTPVGNRLVLMTADYQLAEDTRLLLAASMN